jgi:N-acyl-D-aspartate/D-glutamate deacylase
MGMSDVDAYLHLCEISDFKGRVNMGPYSTREIITSLSKEEHVLFMTDAWREEKGVQNPALYDCFPKFLQDALLNRGDTLPRTIRKMSGATADRFGLQNRGYVKPGCYADLTLFDEQAVMDGIPDVGQPFGIKQVYINGRLVLRDEQLDEQALKTSGQAMRVK